MRNFEQDEIWSVRVWTLGGLAFGLFFAVVVSVTVGRTYAVFAAPFLFAWMFYLSARMHNSQV